MNFMTFSLKNIVYFDHIYPLHHPHLFFLLLLLVFLPTKSPSYFHMCICLSVMYVYVNPGFTYKRKHAICLSGKFR